MFALIHHHRSGLSIITTSLSKDVLLRCSCVLYLLITPGTAIVTKFVCPGDSVKLFETVTFNSQDTVLSLYKNHKMYTLLSQWHKQNSTIKSYIQQEYKEKIYLDENGNIWIRNVNHWDEETYFIKSNISYSYEQYPVKIIIMVAPKKTCKPKITHLDNHLLAHLEVEDCGIPVASLQWLDSPGLSNSISGSVINLHPGHEAGTYYACLKGPALECAKISVPSDYCSSYAVGENDSRPLSSDILDLKTAISVIVPSIIAIGSLVLLIVALYLISKIWRRCRVGLTSRRLQGRFYHTPEGVPGKETTSLLKSPQAHKETFVQADSELQDMTASLSVSDVDKPTLSLKWRFSGKTWDNKRKPWLLDLVLNTDHDLIVTDGENSQLKKFSLNGILKNNLSFQTRPDCLALTDGYLVTVTFPHETVLRVINTKNVLSVVSTIPFKSQCAGISSMKDGRLIISNRDSRSVMVCSKDGEILQEIKTDSSGENLFRKPSYVSVLDNRTVYVSDYRAKGFFIINISDDNTFTINKHKINYPRSSCVVGGMLLVAASSIRLFTLDGKESGEVPLDGVHDVRGLAISEDEQILAVTHQSNADEEISVYEVVKH